MIGIVDLAMGNLRSVSNAVYSLGFNFQVIDSASKFENCSHLIIPGVGSYKTAMEHAADRKFMEPIRKYGESGRPVLGICLGMQLLSTSGTEGGFSEGFNLISGRVVMLDSKQTATIPHMGWNNVVRKREHSIFQGVKDGKDFYFVHSYHFVCDRSEDVLAETNSGQNFTSIVAKKNIVGFQFHPEKSQDNGLKMLENFCNWNGVC